MRRFLAAIGTIALTATALAVTTTAPAAAIGRYEQSTSWAVIDAADPDTVVIDGPGDAPLGTWTEAGVTHTARPYFTFDLSRFQGARILKAILFTGETEAADCANRPPVTLWRTTPVTSGTSWTAPPRDLARISTLETDACKPSHVEWDALKAVQAAVAEGRRTLTLSLRLPANIEDEPANFRTYRSSFGLVIDYNNAPLTPTGLTTNNAACATDKPFTLVRNDRVSLRATATDPDMNETGGGDRLTGRFEVWRVGSTEPRTVLEDSSYAPADMRVDLLPETLVDGATYAWRVRAFDDTDHSAWSETCRFVVDKQAPQGTVTVTSTDYPEDGQWHDAVGRPGEFHFTYTGTDRIAGFYWSSLHGDGRSHFVAADRRGRATVTYAPGDAIDRLEVFGADAAGYRTEETTYDIRAVDQRPTIDGYFWEVGQPTTFTFGSFNGTAVEFRYQLDGEPEQTVAADAEGRAEVEITARWGGDRTLTVTSRTAAGVASTRTARWWLPSEPRIVSAEYPESQAAGGEGVPGTFTFTPRSPGVVAFRYAFSDGTEGTVPVGAASVRWTPAAIGWASVNVWAVDADGAETGPGIYSFQVADRLPGVWSSVYADSGSNGGPGEQGQFYFSSQLGHFEFVYRFDDGPEQVATMFDEVYFTPTTAGPHELRVRSRDSDGTQSPERLYRFVVFGGPRVVSPDYPSDVASGRPGLAGTFTLTPRVPDVVSYRYAFDDGPRQTVAASADGVADVRYTPTTPFGHTLVVTSVDAAGVESEQTTYAFHVLDDTPYVSANGYGWGSWGGIGVEDTFSFTSQLADVADFAYKLNDGAERTVPAVDRAASVVLAPDRAGDNVLSVVARTADGRRSTPYEFRFYVPSAPSVSSDVYPSGYEPGGGVGVPGTFTFATLVPGVTSFGYRFEGEPEQTVPADSDGTASVTWTPGCACYHYLTVWGIKENGQTTDYQYYTFVVAG
ncbi:hypothetical protein [Asanoa sp. NPDC050611]|uniref:hypothetical protein n=1 Tax=Asanoa sp. NPDC050611 TaxID=3157098 RepID=UPI0033CF0059